jgi:hypothetical protein
MEFFRSMKFAAQLTAIACATISLTVSSDAAEREYAPSSFTWTPELSKTGPVLVAVSLKSQTAAVYRNGIKIGSCEVSTGRKGHETPTGVFHILVKDADHHSSIYNNAAMPFSERLTWGGVALHAGGLPGYPSSHGCVHLPFEFSKKLFTVTHNGTTVVISDDTPDVHVSAGHQVGFTSGDASDFVWRPEASHSGPVSLLYSGGDKRLYVIRGGITIGECKVSTGLFSKKPKGVSAFVFTGWNPAKGSKPALPHWVQVGGPEHRHSDEVDDYFKLDPHFRHLVEALLTVGTNLVVTDESMTGAKRSEPGFNILQGRIEEAATAKDKAAPAPTPK